MRLIVEMDEETTSGIIAELTSKWANAVANNEHEYAAKINGWRTDFALGVTRAVSNAVLAEMQTN